MSPRPERARGPSNPCLHLAGTTLAVLLFFSSPTAGGPAESPPSGEKVYRLRCAGCHGAAGEGVAGKHPRPLAGDLSVTELSKYIAENMPEDAPGSCTGPDAEAVARFIHEAFYSPIAQARRRPARIEVSRLTVRQHRNALADLVGSFRRDPPRAPADGGESGSGLRGEYFNSRRPGEKRALRRVDPEVRFDFGSAIPIPEGLDRKGFSARWTGSLAAPDTGEYEVVVSTNHAARLWLNDPERPLIDVWVKSGSDTEHRARIFLLEGRSYPLRLEFTSQKQGVQDKVKDDGKPLEARIELRWRPPGRAAETVPARHLSPAPSAEVFVLSTPFPPDDRSEGWERGSSASAAWDEAATEAALETAAYVSERLGELAGVRRSDPDRGAGAREFCRRFVERAFRRPLDDEARSLYVDRRFEGAPDAETAVKRVVILALKSPRFLVVGPEGPVDRKEESGRAGGGFPAASRLSFALWDSLPDPALLEAAAEGELGSVEEVRRQAARMIDDPRARSKVRGFLHAWLGIDGSPELAKDASRFAGFDEALVSDLRTSLDLFLEEVVWGEEPDFRRLLLSQEIHVNGRMAGYYGFGPPMEEGFRKAAVPPDPGGTPRAAGVLSHPYLMARFAYTEGTSPIHRGVFLARNVLGRSLLPPPEAFTPLPPELHPELTTRERVALQTASRECQSCHHLINPLGFTMERFDAVGRYREAEKGKPIDASGSYLLPSGETRTFRGVRDLAEFLAASEQAQEAFAEQLFQHLAKQPLGAYGPEARRKLRRSFVAVDFDLRRLVREIAAAAALGRMPPPPTPESIRRVRRI